MSCFHQTFPQQRIRARRFCFREITRRIHFSTGSTTPTRNNSNELSDRSFREEINSTEVRYAIQRQKNALLKELNLLQGIVEKKSTIPILSNVLIETANDSSISLVATDLDVSLQTECAAESATKGSIVLAGEKAVRHCPESSRGGDKLHERRQRLGENRLCVVSVQNRRPGERTLSFHSEDRENRVDDSCEDHQQTDKPDDLCDHPGGVAICTQWRAAFLRRRQASDGCDRRPPACTDVR